MIKHAEKLQVTFRGRSVGTGIRMSLSRCRDLIDEVTAACSTIQLP